MEDISLLVDDKQPLTQVRRHENPSHLPIQERTYCPAIGQSSAPVPTGWPQLQGATWPKGLLTFSG